MTNEGMVLFNGLSFVIDSALSHLDLDIGGCQFKCKPIFDGSLRATNKTVHCESRRRGTKQSRELRLLRRPLRNMAGSSQRLMM